MTGSAAMLRDVLNSSLVHTAPTSQLARKIGTALHYDGRGQHEAKRLLLPAAAPQLRGGLASSPTQSSGSDTGPEESFEAIMYRAG